MTNKKKTQSQFVSEMADLSPSIDVLGEYVNARTHILVKCRHCGNEWLATPTNLLRGRGCSRCARSATSFLEQAILAAFRECLGEENVLSRDKTLIGKELDILVPELKVAYEPGSWYFHKNRLSNDREKQRLCRDKDVKLVVIYTECEGQIPLFDDDIKYFYESFGATQWDDVVKLVSGLLAEFNLVLTADQWTDVRKTAARFSRYTTTADFKAALAGINPNVEVLGEYESATSKTKVRCRKCEYVWEATPHHLLEGHGCQRCGNTLLKSDDEFRDEIRTISPTITIVGEYRTAKKKVRVHCDICGHEWHADPSALRAGHGCPHCNGGIRYTQEVFEEKLRQVHPTIEVLGSYVNSVTEVNLRCATCGYEWAAKPASLLSSQGCPKCNKRLRRTHEQFVEELAGISPTIEVLGKFEGTRERVLVRCTECGREWEPVAYNLLAGHGCQSCNNRRRNAEQSPSAELTALDGAKTI